MNEDKHFDFSAIRKKLGGLNTPSFWKSFDELAETDEFKSFLKHEYPYEAADFSTPVSRREFLKLMGASFVMAGLAGCAPQPVEKIVPYHSNPKNMVPGKPLYFATGMVFNGHATGLLAESNMGRPTKLEGNPEHPDSLGATSVFHQAAIYSLYDPERSKTMIHRGKISTWDHFVADLGNELTAQKAKKGSGLRILTETVISPTLGRQLKALLAKYPNARWHQYEALTNDAARRAQKTMLTEYANPLYDFKKADVILSLDSDFLVNLPGSLRYAREFASRRNPESSTPLSRVYVMESSPTLAGSAADHRLALSPAELEAAAAEIAKRLGVVVEGKFDKAALQEHKPWIDAVVNDLRDAKSKALVVPGEYQSSFVHALAIAMNQILGSAGETVSYIDPIEALPVEHGASFEELNRDMDQGKVDLLIVLGANPVYTAPGDSGFADKLQKIRKIIHLGLYQDETAAVSHWHIPQAHFLEIFSDARASDGSVTLIQPLIQPLYGGKSDHEILSVLLENPSQSGLDIIQETWKDKLPSFEQTWNQSVHDGLIRNTAFPKKTIAAKTQITRAELKLLGESANGADSGGLTAVFRPDPSIWDGRFANIAWLQELPKPFTKLTWDNAVLISPKTSESLSLQSGDVVTIQSGSVSIEAPVWITPGHPHGTATLSLGYGRKMNGKVGNQIGFNVYPLRTRQSVYQLEGIKISKTGKTYKLASTQVHHSMENRNLVRKATAEEFKQHPHFAQSHVHGGGAQLTLYPPHDYPDNKWGMAINLNSCIGCNACVLACQTENNSPVVGKEEVLMGREMQWIRVDRYYSGDLDHPDIHFQPVMCMHCENAPCEPVCPVGATVHSDEGLNEMVYNRCVGTKYCSNNCPYKVRRFNFFEYSDRNTESFKMMRNPEVTVRFRGVMEKCTFCVQRISAARIDAAKENRPIKDGEVVTACQAACPTQAITFGNLNDEKAAVTAKVKSPLNYGLLTDLNTNPRVSYLAHVVNPNPKLVKAAVHGH